jgi:hypothetical protein
MSGVIVGFADAALRSSFASHVSSWHWPVGIVHVPLCGTHWFACAPSTE